MYLQVGVACARLAADPAVLELGEVALEEADLVLVCRAWHVGRRPLDGVVVVDCALVDGGLGLGNQLRPPHVTVPLGRAVNGDLGSLLATSIARVLVAWRKVDVFGRGT